MELCVSLNQLFNWIFLFQQVVWKSTHPLHCTIQCLLQFPYNIFAEIHSIVSLLCPLFRSHCFNELNMEFSQCEREHFGCATYNLVRVLYSIKITPTYTYTYNQVAKFLKTTELYRFICELVCMVSTIYMLCAMIFLGDGLLCHSFHCRYFVHTFIHFLATHTQCVCSQNVCYINLKCTIHNCLRTYILHGNFCDSVLNLSLNKHVHIFHGFYHVIFNDPITFFRANCFVDINLS